ncbi:MAG: hypothetical protein U0804_20785 [Gemmataceae bacterium]
MRLIRSRVWSAVVGVVAVGCGREVPSPPPAVAFAEPAPVAPAPAPVAPQAPPPAPPPPVPPPVFPFPTDTAGKELPKVVAPRAPAPLPVERFGAAPKQSAPSAVVSPDPLGKIAVAAPPALPKRPGGFSPQAPAERVPFDLGVGAAAVPVRPSFAVAPAEVVRAPDVNQPPPLASLAKQVPDRASLEDPSAEPAGAVIVNRVVNPAYVRAEFWRIVLPDPFELAAQVRPVVPPAADPGLTPVTVNPMRPR